MKLNICRQKTCKDRGGSRGFTFLELMIVIAVTVLLLGIALPAYQDFVVRSKLQSGTEGLSALSGLLTQVYADNRSYRTLDDTACRIATYPTIMQSGTEGLSALSGLLTQCAGLTRIRRQNPSFLPHPGRYDITSDGMSYRYLPDRAF